MWTATPRTDASPSFEFCAAEQRGTDLSLGEEDASLASLGVQRELDAARLVLGGHAAGGADARHGHARHGVHVHVHVHVHARHVHVDRRRARAHQPTDCVATRKEEICVNRCHSWRWPINSSASQLSNESKSNEGRVGHSIPLNVWRMEDADELPVDSVE